jgi:hypothetical protein
MKLKKYIFRTDKRGLDIPVDFTSYRYRCCPNCQHEFMAEDLREKYCSDACKDDFNNALKRQTQAEVLQLKQDFSEKESFSLEKINQDSREILERNIQEIDQLFINDKDDVYASFEELNKKGVDLSINNGQGDLYNTPDESKCKFLIIGPYHLFRVSFDTALIVNSKSI